MMKYPLLVMVFSILLLCSSPVSGVMIQVPLDKLVHRAPIIVEGEVLRCHAYWNTDGTMIFTDVLVTVFDQIKGRKVPAVVVVRLPGGQVGDVACRVSDTPAFEVGERVLLFVKPISDVTVLGLSIADTQHYELVERAQGKVSIQDDTAIRSGYTLFPNLKEANFQYPYSQLRDIIVSQVEMERGR